MKIATVQIKTLTPDPANARTHSKRNLEAIKESLSRYGQQKPLVVDGDGQVVAGNGTMAAAVELGWDKIAIVRTQLTGAEAVAFAIADNRTSELAEWDNDALAKALLAANEGDLGLEGTGFNEKTMRRLVFEMEEARHLGEDDDEMPTGDAVTERGDLWLLGDHRVLCGDSRKDASWKVLLNGDKADMIWTDPPYGVDYTGGPLANRKAIKDDTMEGLGDLLTQALGNLLAHSKQGAVWYVAAPSGPAQLDFLRVMTTLDIWHQTLIWVKDSLVMGRSDFHHRHELLLYGWSPGAAHMTPPSRKIDTIWEFARPKRSDDHPTMKPIPLVARSIELSSKPGELVTDAFLGSGTTLMACATLGDRRCAGIEFEPEYVDSTVRRWEKLTGEEATLFGTDQTFSAVQASRQA